MKIFFQTRNIVSLFSKAGKAGIKLKLILIAVLLTLFAVVATLVPALFLFTQYNNTIAAEQVQAGMKGLTITLKDYQKNALNFGAVMASHPGVIKGIKDKDALTILEQLGPLLSRANIDFATITDETGTVIVRTHDQKRGDSVVNQDNIKNALKGVAYAAIESGTVVKFSARAGTPVKDEAGRIVGVISAGYYISNDLVVDRIKEAFGTDVTLFLGDERVATTIMRDGQRMLGSKLDEEIASKVLKDRQEYVGTVAVVGIPYITAYKPLMGPEDKPMGALFVGKNMETLNAARDKVVLFVGGISLLVLISVSIIAVVISNKMTSPIRNLVLATERVAGGNLTNFVEVASKDEIGTLAQGFNQMIERLKSLIANVNSSAGILTAASHTLKENGEQSAQAVNQVAATIDDMARGAEEQRAAVEETASVIEQLVIALQQVAANANDAAVRSSKTTDAAQQGSKAVADALNQMNAIEISVVNSAAELAKLGERSTEIGSIVDAISGIAGQTNLLALNAAIEAARAGEQGRGFAVVAEEVRKLAEQSQEAAKQIAALIGEIQRDTDKTVAAMNDSTHEVKVGAGVVASAGQVFNDILVLVTEVAGQVNQIAAASQQMVNGSQQIVQSTNKINQVSNEAASQAQTVSASIEEQSAVLEELAVSSQTLTAMAQELQLAVSKFKI
ncbi:methyl-accepting chemotaxis protein [Sporomusa sphaeroides]|uniref:methyl-accepting chemotaxis protein n=1 Tax=Sporomusa sphaeroides TaxID=47679 RepID=UPI002CC725AC|nr:methyl-accepting chemotaxis protein [Sporomusa sphaeroides]HML33731.1 methyl-accepting chemotaxis protein [Sporomusa sphaeroides]